MGESKPVTERKIPPSCCPECGHSKTGAHVGAYCAFCKVVSDGPCKNGDHNDLPPWEE